MISTEIHPIKSPNARVEKNFLVINDDVTKKEWKEIGHNLSQIQGNIQFWIGDWVRFGNKKNFYTSSEVYDEVVEITGFERGTIQNYKWVAEQTSSTRVEELSFSHHRVVAKLDETQQTYFLNRAIQEKLSVPELSLQVIYQNPLQNSGDGIRYNNQGAFPVRLGDLHIKLQTEAFEMKTSIHDRALTILREYFERKENEKIIVTT